MVETQRQWRRCRRREALQRTLRTLLAAVGAAAGGPGTAWAEPAAQEAPWAALRAGGILLMRHARAPGVGDPPGFRLDDCRTQRNLDSGGRQQARQLGEALRRRGVPVGAVWSSRWCRARDTAQLLGMGAVREEPAFDSFFGDAAQEPGRTEAARRLLQGWTGPGALVVVTHQVNITALTGGHPGSAEGVVLVPRGDAPLAVAGRIETED